MSLALSAFYPNIYDFPEPWPDHSDTRTRHDPDSRSTVPTAYIHTPTAPTPDSPDSFPTAPDSE